jgi:plasmid stabilization system protein ParE
VCFEESRNFKPPAHESFLSDIGTERNLRTSPAFHFHQTTTGRRVMPRGDKSAYSGKQKRKAEHIEEGYEDRGVKKKEAERRAWATVNKESGGGKKSGSGRGKKTTKISSKRGGRIGGPRGGKAAAARPAAARSRSAKKAAATRKRAATKRSAAAKKGAKTTARKR